MISMLYECNGWGGGNPTQVALTLRNLGLFNKKVTEKLLRKFFL